MKPRKSTWLLAALLTTTLSALPQSDTVTEANLPLYVARVVTYQAGESLEPFRAIEELVRQSGGKPSLRKLLEHQLGSMLSPTATEETRLFAARQLAIMGSERSLPDIARMLNHDETVGLGCLALSTYPRGKADEVLRSALANTTGKTQVQIINTLGDRRDSGSVKALAELASGSDPAVADAAVFALAKIGSSPARKALDTLFEDDSRSESIRTLAGLQTAIQLAEEGDRDAVPMLESLIASSHPVHIRRGALAALLKLDQKNAPLRIVDVLRGQDAALKPVAIATVRDLRAKDASENFGGIVLPQLPAEQQIWMIDSLAVRKDPPAVSAIINRLGSSTDANVRQAAAQALGRIGESSFATPLAKALAASTNRDEARVIVAAVAALNDSRATDQAVLAEIQAAEGQPRAQLVSSLAARRSPEVITALFEELDDSDPAVAKAAFRVMSKAVTGHTLFDLLTKFARLRNEKLQADVETFMDQAVLTVEDNKPRSEAVRKVLAQTFHTSGRAALVRMLPLCGDTNALKVAIRCLHDAERPVRDSAVDSLAEWPDIAAWDVLLNVHKTPRDPRYRLIAMRGLVRLASEQNAKPNATLIERYRQLLAAAREDAERKLVLGALGGVAHPDALQLAVSALSLPRVRAEAEAAIKRIAEAVQEQHPEEAKMALNRISRRR